MPARRLICLSAESADVLQRLGAWGQVVGVSAFCRQPQHDRRPVVGGFSRGSIDKVKALKPDLVLLYSDVQAEMGAALAHEGLNVLLTNSFTLEEIGEHIVLLGNLVGAPRQAEELAAEFRNGLQALAKNAAPLTCPPRVYFEEWPDPPVCGAPWISEGMELIGGWDVFRSRRSKRAGEREIDPSQIPKLAPELIFVSWCGRSADLDQIRSRPGWDMVPAVIQDRIHEIPPEEILQAGPRVLEGLNRMQKLLNRVVP